jgi:hypothetical protein
MTVSTFATYTADSIYATTPQFVRDQDADNTITPYNVGNFSVNAVTVNSPYLATANSRQMFVESTAIFPTPCKIWISGNGNTETIVVNSVDKASNGFLKLTFKTALKYSYPAGSNVVILRGPLYNFLNSIGSILDKQVNVLSRDNVGIGNSGQGADGTVDMKNYGGVMGWSQALDIDRCPNYALPWLAQFIGTPIPEINTLTREQMVSKMKDRSSFKRGTDLSLVNALVTVLNLLGNEPSAITAEQILVMENTKWNGTCYTGDNNSLVILLPMRFLVSENYQFFLESFADYQAIKDNFPYYSNMVPSPTPNLNNQYTQYIYRYRPAGVYIYIGGY